MSGRDRSTYGNRGRGIRLLDHSKNSASGERRDWCYLRRAGKFLDQGPITLAQNLWGKNTKMPKCPSETKALPT